ncbi:hypothetical protein Tco_0835706 [Tanacetum coccineum]
MLYSWGGQHRRAKDLIEKLNFLMQGTTLSKQEPNTKFLEGQSIQTCPDSHTAAYQAKDLDSYDSDCDKLTSQSLLMVNLCPLWFMLLLRNPHILLDPTSERFQKKLPKVSIGQLIPANSRHSHEEAAVLRSLLYHVKANYPLDPVLESAYNIMEGINIDDLTIEQYLRLTQENQTPSMDMELDEEAGYTTDEKSVVSEHEAIDLAHTVNTQSFEEELSSGEDLDEWLKAKMEKHMKECRVVHKNKQISASEADQKKYPEAMEDTINNDSFTSNSPYQPSLEKLNPGSFLLPFTIDNYNSYAMANIDANNNVMPRSIYEYLKPANLGGPLCQSK